MVTADARLDLTVTDLKQWAYCPRIPFYRYVLPVEPGRTYKMQRGRNAQTAIEALERRRRVREYGLEAADRRFDVQLHSRRLGLSGRLDLLLVTPDACFPVDFKDTEGGARRNHRLQLAAYALLAEEAFHRPAPEGFIYLVPTNDVVRVELGPSDRSWVEAAVVGLRAMVRLEAMPKPTPVRARCLGCEFQNYCADIW